MRQVELTAVILLLVASNRGVSVLPDWVLRESRTSSDYITRRLTEKGVTKRLYAAIRAEDRKPYMAHLLKLGPRHSRAPATRPAGGGLTGARAPAAAMTESRWPSAGESPYHWKPRAFAVAAHPTGAAP